MVNPHFVVKRLVSVAVLLLVLVATHNAVAVEQPAATPEDGCPGLVASPVPHQATPTAKEQASPETATPFALIHDGPVTDQASLVETLQTCGVTVDTVGPVEQPFLQAESGTALRLSGVGLAEPADVQVFEYQDPDSAAADAAQIGPDGNPPTMMIHWLAPPHFFMADRLIVLYVGEDEAVVDLLTALLGPPFAGG